MLTIIDISPSGQCNYACPYCIAHAYKGAKMPGINNDLCTVKGGHMIHPAVAADWIKKHFDPKETLVSIAGGEPTIYTGFIELVKSLVEYKKTVVSNGCITTKFIKKYFPAIWDYKVRFKLSWHPTMRSFEQFMEDIKDLPRDKVLINLVAWPYFVNTGDMDKYFNQLINSGYKYNVNAFKGTYEGNEYSKEWEPGKKFYTWETEWQPFQLFAINPDGGVFHCYKKYLGNIYSDDNIDTVMPSPKCVIPQGCADNIELSSCDCFNSIMKLWEVTNG